MSPAISEKIVKFSGEPDSDEQIPADLILDNITDSAINIEKYPLKTFFDRNFNIPEYQRGYEWEENEWKSLWQEIEPIFDAEQEVTSSRIRDVFFGSMFFAERHGNTGNENGDPEHIFDIIDGQQRVTTLTLIFNIIADKIQEEIEKEPELVSEIPNALGNTRELVFEDSSAGASDTPAVRLDQRNRDFFDSLVVGEKKQLEYLLKCGRVHGNTKENAIKVGEYLDKLNIPIENYLKAVDDESYYTDLDDSSRRPNIRDRVLDDLRDSEIDNLKEDNTEISDIDDEVIDEWEEELRDNKVRIIESNKLLLDAHVYFRGELDDKLKRLDNPRERAYSLINTKDYILNSFIVGYFQVDDDRPRLLMRIFEVLNDRGVELKKTDLIRTRIVAYLRQKDEETKEEYLEKWESIITDLGNARRVIRFLRTYFVVKGDVTSRGSLKNRLLEAFSDSKDSDAVLEPRLHDEDSPDVLTGLEFIDDLAEYKRYYHDLIDPYNRQLSLGEDGDEDVIEECNYIITRLNKANTSIWEPIVLAVYHDIGEGKMGKQRELVKLLRDVESMAIRAFAAMDTNVRDDAYANAISEYQDDKLDSNYREELTDIESDDPQATGSSLVESFYQVDWRKQWGKQALRKISSEGYGDETENVVVRNLNLDDSLVTLEHIFPRSSIRDSGEEYAWHRHFFRVDEDHESELESETDDESEGEELDEDEIEWIEIKSELADVIEDLIDDESNSKLKDIADEYMNDIGNLSLLRSTENIQTGNSLFHDKLIHYVLSEEFEQLESNKHISDKFLDERAHPNLYEYCELEKKRNEIRDDPEGWEEYKDAVEVDVDSQEELLEEVNKSQEELREELSSLDSEWTYSEVTDNRSKLIKSLCESIKFDDDEFNEVDFEELSQKETKRRSRVIAANYKSLS